MTEVFDVESVISKLVSVVRAGLNTKLTAIDTEKGDFTLKQFTDPSGSSEGAYSILSTDQQVMNFNPFLFVGCQMPGTQALQSATAVDVEIDLVAVLEIEGGDANTWKRLLRYQRALKEVIQENWGDTGIYGEVLIESLEPRPLEDMGVNPYMGCGIRLKTTLV